MYPNIVSITASTKRFCHRINFSQGENLKSRAAFDLYHNPDYACLGPLCMAWKWKSEEDALNLYEVIVVNDKLVGTPCEDGKIKEELKKWTARCPGDRWESKEKKPVLTGEFRGRLVTTFEVEKLKSERMGFCGLIDGGLR